MGMGEVKGRKVFPIAATRVKTNRTRGNGGEEVGNRRPRLNKRMSFQWTFIVGREMRGEGGVGGGGKVGPLEEDRYHISDASNGLVLVK